MAGRLVKFKADETYNVVVYELAESLIFNKIYSLIYFSIKSFNFEEENILREKLNQTKNEFTFTTYNVDPIINQCKFLNALQELRRLPFISAPFEKLVLFK